MSQQNRVALPFDYSLKCPFCQGSTEVLETRRTDTIAHPNSIKRRRQCLKCSARVTTYEEIRLKPGKNDDLLSRRGVTGQVAPIDGLMAALEWQSLPLPEQLHQGLYATHQGTLSIGEFEFRCYQLSDGQRVVDAEDMEKFFWAAIQGEGN